MPRPREFDEADVVAARDEFWLGTVGRRRAGDATVAAVAPMLNDVYFASLSNNFPVAPHLWGTTDDLR